MWAMRSSPWQPLRQYIRICLSIFFPPPTRGLPHTGDFAAHVSNFGLICGSVYTTWMDKSTVPSL